MTSPITFNRMPTYQESLTSKDPKKVTTRGWYTLWQGLWQGQPTGPVSVVRVTASPFIYTATQGGSLIVQGGSTTQIQFTRNDGNLYVIGQTAGMFPLSQGDSLIVTYSVAPPNVTFVPR